MIYTATCLNCGHITYAVYKSNTCSKCGRIMLTETSPQRDKRLGIKKMDPDTWNAPDPLLAHLNKDKKVTRCG